MDWPYGEIMYEQGDIESLDKWSDDLEVACSIMDERFDYLWRIEGNKITFTDRLYSCGERDEEVEKRINNNEAEMTFNSFDDVFQWILDQNVEDIPYRDWMLKKLKKSMTIYKSRAELIDGKIIELLWDDFDEVMEYFNGLANYTRCIKVEVWEMESQPDHVFKDVERIAKVVYGEEDDYVY